MSSNTNILGVILLVGIITLRSIRGCSMCLTGYDDASKLNFKNENRIYPRIEPCGTPGVNIKKNIPFTQFKCLSLVQHGVL